MLCQFVVVNLVDANLVSAVSLVVVVYLAASKTGVPDAARLLLNLLDVVTSS